MYRCIYVYTYITITTTISIYSFIVQYYIMLCQTLQAELDEFCSTNELSDRAPEAQARDIGATQLDPTSSGYI